MSAVLLVVASAGFGCLFAWQTGAVHSKVLGVLSVAMALGLELSKPFAIAGMFAALRRWHFATALALALTGLLAIDYSLQAELQFMSTTRGDIVAERAGEAQTGQRAEERYRRAVDALAALKPTGTSEKATNAYLAQRRALQAEIEAAELDRRTAPSVAVADPGAVALATYLGALGVNADVDQLGRWLPLVGVLALELGAAFSVVLVRANACTVVQQPLPAQGEGGPAPGPEAAEKPARPAKRARDRRPPDDGPGPANGRGRGLPAVLAALQTGAVHGSQRTIAETLGVSKSTVLRAQRLLEDRGFALA